MQLGFVSAILPDLALDELARFAASAGYDCVELMCWPAGKAERRYAGVTHVDVTDFSRADAERVREVMAESGVEISALGYYPNPLSPDAEEAAACIRHLERVIAAAALLGVSRMNTFVGRDWTKSVEENWPRFLEVWRPLISFAEERGVKVGIENCPMFFTRHEWPGGKNLATSPAIWRRMFADIPSDYFGLNYDPSHPVLLRMDYLKPLKEFAGKLFHIHAKDVLFDRAQCDDWGVLGLQKDYHRPRIPGYGEIDWAKFVGALMETSYDGPICIEVEDETFGKSNDGRKRAVKVARNVLAPFFAR